jgi:hypothetical protein
MPQFKNNLALLAALVLLMAVVAGCSQGSSGSQPPSEEDLKAFTLEELAPALSFNNRLKNLLDSSSSFHSGRPPGFQR